MKNAKQKSPNTVGLKELRENTEEYISRVEKGESFTVLRRSKPVFNITPFDEWGDEGVWETAADFTKVDKDGVPAEDVLKALKKMRT